MFEKLVVGKRVSIRLDDDDLLEKVEDCLAQGARVQLMHAGSHYTGPVSHETIAIVDGELAIRPQERWKGGWRKLDVIDLRDVVMSWRDRTIRNNIFKRGKRGGLGYYLIARKTLKQPEIGRRR